MTIASQNIGQDRHILARSRRNKVSLGVVPGFVLALAMGLLQPFQVFAQEQSEVVKLYQMAMDSQNKELAAKDREIQALRESIDAKDRYIQVQTQQIEEWKELAGAKGLSKKEKFRLGLSIAGSVAAVVGVIAGK